ncbi:MAG: hypothetical protein IKL08_07430 [Clostridia bacterium]|nr:hypothetical protein [Clostridia bacterium]
MNVTKADLKLAKDLTEYKLSMGGQLEIFIKGLEAAQDFYKYAEVDEAHNKVDIAIYSCKELRTVLRNFNIEFSENGGISSVGYKRNSGANLESFSTLEHTTHPLTEITLMFALRNFEQAICDHISNITKHLANTEPAIIYNIRYNLDNIINQYVSEKMKEKVQE